MVSGILITQWTVTGVVMLSVCGTFLFTAGWSGEKVGELAVQWDLTKLKTKADFFQNSTAGKVRASKTLEVSLMYKRYRFISYLYELWICLRTVLDWAFGNFRHESSLSCVCEIHLNISKLIFACVQQWEMASLWVF